MKLCLNEFNPVTEISTAYLNCAHMGILLLLVLNQVNSMSLRSISTVDF